MTRWTFARRAAVFGAALMVVAVGFLVAVQSPPTASAQLPPSPYRSVDPVSLSLDGQAWTLNFAYITPRITKVKTPDKGERTVWYMPYYVYNNTGAPRTFQPEFELVTKDPDGVVMSSLDEAQPSVVDELRKIEDPLGKYNFHTSVSIAKDKIPVALPDTYARSQAVYGIAVWLDVPEKANPNLFSVYVTGLSDGLARKEVEEKGQVNVVISRKTLQLDFKRPVASKVDKSDDIKVNENNGLGSETWRYRESQVIPKVKAPAAPGGGK